MSEVVIRVSDEYAAALQAEIDRVGGTEPNNVLFQFTKDVVRDLNGPCPLVTESRLSVKIEDGKLAGPEVKPVEPEKPAEPDKEPNSGSSTDPVTGEDGSSEVSS